MRRRLAVVAGLLCVVVAARAQERGAVDWIFLVDTSQSMRGVGGTKDIFGEVQASLQTFVREANDGDSVSLYTFDRDVRSHGLRDMRGPFDRSELTETIRGLEANGNRTHLGAAIAKGLERSEAMLARGAADPGRVRALVLFTDGKEDVRGVANPVSIPSNVQRALKSNPLMFFVSLGEHEAQLDDFPNAKVLKAHDPDAIRRLAHDIRAIVKPPPPRRPLALTVSPAMLHFGELEPGQSSRELALTISANQPANVTVTLAPTPGITIRPQNVSVTQDAPAHISMKLDVAEDAAPGPRRVTIVASSARATAVFTIAKPSPLILALKWLGASAILVLLLVTTVMWNNRRNHLEGELEIVKPRVAPDATYVGLPNIKAKEVALSSIVPADALGGNDARLFVQRKSGEKKVWIAARSGTLRVNDIELPMSELYDADTIRIGDATLRFNRIGHERPSLQEDLA